MTGELHCLDKGLWTEIPDRVVIKAGTTYIGKEFKPDDAGNPTHEIRVFVRKIVSESEDHVCIEVAYEYVRQCARKLSGVLDIDAKAAWWVVTGFGLDAVTHATPRAVSEMITAYIEMHVLSVENNKIVEHSGPGWTTGACYPPAYFAINNSRKKKVP